MDLQLFEAISKYPFVFEDVFYNSADLMQNKTCTNKCKEKDCLRMLSKGSHLSTYVCSKGFDNLVLVIGEFKFLLNGLIYETNRGILKDRREARKDWIVKKEAVDLFANKLEQIERHLIESENKATEKNFSIFHDFKTSMNIFFNCTQNIISNLPGSTFEEKLKKSDKSYQDLYDALELITSQLGMVDVIINPKSISFGERREINIYKLFDKVRKLFRHHAANKRDVNIELVNIDGAYISNSSCYESIEFIPIILLDNALKYSAKDSTVKIEIKQSYDEAIVSVKNIGPFVSDENKDKIFEKFFRDESAISFSKEGIGLGLWIAQQILEAHESKMFYYKDPHESRRIGLNIFEFKLKTASPWAY